MRDCFEFMKRKNAQFELLLLNRSPPSLWRSWHTINHVRDPHLGQSKTGHFSLVTISILYPFSVSFERKRSLTVVVVDIAELYAT